MAGKGISRRLTTLLVAGLLSATCSSLRAAQTDEGQFTSDSSPHNIKTVFIIMMENHNWTGDGALSLRSNIQAPYINLTLMPMASHANRYFNAPHMHPSLPNYLWLEAGSNLGVKDSGNSIIKDRQSTHEHLAYLLDKAKISWKAYDERTDGLKCPLTYWHTPFVFFDDMTNNMDPHSPMCIAHIRPLSEMKRDLSKDKVARYNFIVPNLCDDMHKSCNGKNPIKEGDDWLAKTVPEILKSTAYRSGGVLFIVWDEADNSVVKSNDGPIPMIVLSPFAKGNGYSNNIHYTHSSTLRTIQEIFGVGPLMRNAAKSNDLRDLFTVFP